jgi:hypothetical protein
VLLCPAVTISTAKVREWLGTLLCSASMPRAAALMMHHAKRSPPHSSAVFPCCSKHPLAALPAICADLYCLVYCLVLHAGRDAMRKADKVMDSYRRHVYRLRCGGTAWHRWRRRRTSGTQQWPVPGSTLRQY